MLLYLGILVALCPFQCLTAVHHTHPPHENGERDAITFYYDPASHYLIAITRSTCFVASLEKDEYDQVHSNIGMDGLELKMMREWIGKLPETRIYHDDQHFPTSALSHCKGHDIYFLERSGSTLVGSTRTTAAASATSVGVGR